MEPGGAAMREGPDMDPELEVWPAPQLIPSLPGLQHGAKAPGLGSSCKP